MDFSSGLTVGRVSGLISLGNAVVALTIPLLLAFALLHHFDHGLSAASWSVLGRQVHKTAWPSLLRTDTVATTHVHWTVTVVAYLNVALPALSVLCGVITPFGLHEMIRPIQGVNVPFQYLPDLSTFGKATFKRPDMPPSRDCNSRYYMVCPGANVSGTLHKSRSGDNGTSAGNFTSTAAIPSNITAMFNSLSEEDSTLLSTLDIQYRLWKPTVSEHLNSGQPYVRGQIGHVDSLLSKDDLVLVEGLVVDMSRGGVGFRNHTAPLGLPFGATWDEDILWIEPEISCSSTNMSLLYTLADATEVFTNPLMSKELVDEGGFSYIRRGDPYVDWPAINITAPNPALRAERTAWLGNVLTSIVLNLSDISSVGYGLNVSYGQHYQLPVGNIASDLPGAQAIGLNDMWLNQEFNRYSVNEDGNLYENDKKLGPPRDFPYQFARKLFQQIDGRCSGDEDGYYEHIDHNVQCTYFLDAPTRVDGGNRLMREPGSKWKSKMYVCASAAKASVKTVSFRMNETARLTSLVAESIKDKEYKSEKDHPIWALEDWNIPGFISAKPCPFWGMVDSRHAGTPGFNFTKAPYFYLPDGSVSMSSSDGDTVDSLAGLTAPTGVLSQLFQLYYAGANGRIPSYRGTDSIALSDRWTALSGTTQGAETMLRLMWSDFMASITVGASPAAANQNSHNSKRVVTAYRKSVAYDVRYAIPAILLLLSWLLLIVGMSATALLVGRPVAKLRHMLNHTSVGRIAALRHDSQNNNELLRATTKEWLDTAGAMPLRLCSETGEDQTLSLIAQEVKR